MANIITELHLEMSDNWYVTKKLNSVGRVGENTVTKLIIEPTEIIDNVTYEIEIADASGSKNVAELTIDGTELYLILTANMLTTSGIMKMQVRGLFTDGSIKKSNIFELKVNRSISATEAYEEYAVTIFDQLVQDCRDIIEGAESYAIRAETAAVNAEAYEQSASASAEAASTAATTASTSATTATTAAETATAASTSASTSAETATTAANSASASAGTAQTSAQTAQSASVTAQSASEAAVSASTAATSAATSAENSATSASTAASNASASATAASNSATSATTAASNAATSETNAAASASSASTSAANANTSATNAANSAVAAATSATNAHNSEVNASTSETNASTSATEAAASAESIAASVAQINENTYRINDLEAIIAGYQLTDLPTGAVASVTDGTALLMPSLKIDIEPVQEGSGVPSPENIRPISGWTAANVTRTGKNLFDKTAIENNKWLNISTGEIESSAGYAVTAPIKVEANKAITTSYPYSSRRWLYDNNGNAITLIQTNTFTPSQDGYIRLTLALNNVNLDTFQVELGSTATAYEPYNGQTYTIEFKDSDNPLTVYGGTLDAVSGELVVDRVVHEFNGTEYWFLLSVTTNSILYDTGTAMLSSYNNLSKTICSHYDVERSGGAWANLTNGHFMVAGGTFVGIYADDANTLKSYLAGQYNAGNPVTVVASLAEPITYHLTPTQIRTLVGNNNIWADTSDIISGKYYKSLT